MWAQLGTPFKDALQRGIFEAVRGYDGSHDGDLILRAKHLKQLATEGSPW